jgi:hypothetical protein
MDEFLEDHIDDDRPIGWKRKSIKIISTSMAEDSHPQARRDGVTDRDSDNQ